MSWTAASTQIVDHILRAAEAGETFTVTVRGRPAARLGPPVEVDRATMRRNLASPVDADLARELDEAEAPVGDPWPGA